MKPAPFDNPLLLAGIHPVAEALKKDNYIHRLIIQLGLKNPKVYALQKIADKKKIHVQQLPKNFLDHQFRGPHQGILAFCHQKPLMNWEELCINLKNNTTEASLLVLLSGLEDPRNLGASIRSAAGLGAAAVLLPMKGTCGLTTIAAKASAGAWEKIPICQVRDMEIALKTLKEMDYSIVGLDGHLGQSLYGSELPTRCVAVLGGEDKGIPPHVHRNCDAFVRIPIGASVNSYNASVALSLFLYEYARQGKFKTLN